MTKKILIDTCVWLDLAKDYRMGPVLAAIATVTRTMAAGIQMKRVMSDGH